MHTRVANEINTKRKKDFKYIYNGAVSTETGKRNPEATAALFFSSLLVSTLNKCPRNKEDGQGMWLLGVTYLGILEARPKTPICSVSLMCSREL